jgi:hypothetical protein
VDAEPRAATIGEVEGFGVKDVLASRTSPEATWRGHDSNVGAPSRCAEGTSCRDGEDSLGAGEGGGRASDSPWGRSLLPGSGPHPLRALPRHSE